MESLRNSPFCGRDDDLNRLKEAWAAFLMQDGPAATVLLGESGLGKTRLVQEFYAWLRATYDDAAPHYWPEELGREGNNLRINPSFQQLGLRLEGGAPFLWWGLRFPQTTRRNEALGSALESYTPNLVPHFIPVHLERKRLARLKGASSLVFDAVGNFVTLGSLATLKAVVDAGFAGKEIWEQTQELRELNQASAAQQREQQAESLAEVLLGDLSALFKQGVGVAAPLVLVIDDGHWSPHDPLTVGFLGALTRRAKSESWHVFFVMTYWENAWREHAGQVAASVRSIALLREPREIVLRKVTDLRSVLGALLPGLTEEQAQTLLEKADGNPQLLEEIVLFYRGNERFFEGNDCRQPLRPRAHEACVKRSFPMHELARDRFLQASDAAKATLSAGAAQDDIQFLPRVVEEIASALTLADVPQGLIQAAEGSALIDLLAQNVAEFRHRSFFDAAREYLDAAPDDAARVRKATEEAILRLAVDETRLDAMSSLERGLCLRLALELLADERGDARVSSRGLVLAALIRHETGLMNYARARAYAVELGTFARGLPPNVALPREVCRTGAIAMSRLRGISSMGSFLAVAFARYTELVRTAAGAELEGLARECDEIARLSIHPGWSASFSALFAHIVERFEKSEVEIAGAHLDAARRWLEARDAEAATKLAAKAERLYARLAETIPGAIVPRIHSLIMMGRIRVMREGPATAEYVAAARAVLVAELERHPDLAPIWKERLAFDLAFENGERPIVTDYTIMTNDNHAAFINVRQAPSMGLMPAVYLWNEGDLFVRYSDGKEFVVPGIGTPMRDLMQRLPAVVLIRVLQPNFADADGRLDTPTAAERAGADMSTPVYNGDRFALHEVRNIALTWAHLSGQRGDLLTL